EAVREIAARQIAAIGAGLALAVHEVQIGGTARTAPLDNAVGNLGDYGVQISHANSLRRARSARLHSTAPSFPPCSSAAPCRPPPMRRGSNRSTATVPPPRRGARTASGRPR